MSDTTKPNALDPSAILQSTVQTVNDLKNPYDAIAAAVHSIMLSVGFRFAGLGDDARQEGDGTVKRLPAEWNQNGPHMYSFRYSHPQSSLTFVIKTVKLGDKCVILGLGIGDNKTHLLEFLAEDYTSASFFPFESSSDRPLVHGFISSNRFEDFIKAFKLKILQQLIPGLQKPGYEEDNSSSSSQHNTDTRPSRTPRHTNDDNNDYRNNNDDHIYGVGRDDLVPLPDQGLRMPGRGGGMYVGPNHPMFGNRGSLDDPSGLFGGPQPLPRGSVPPGARFDPIGPFGGLPQRPGSGNRGSGRFPRNFAGEPDNDELPPPGFDNMFM